MITTWTEQTPPVYSELWTGDLMKEIWQHSAVQKHGAIPILIEIGGDKTSCSSSGTLNVCVTQVDWIGVPSIQHKYLFYLG